MFYILNNNVYLVQGHARSCIYDFNSAKLYSVNNILAQKIKLINEGGILSEFIDKDLSKVLDKLVEFGVLITSETPTSHQIDDTKVSDTGCNFAWIEITNKCNLKCRHCYNKSSPNCNAVMSLQSFKVAVDSLLDMGVHKVQIIGGEPFFDADALRNMLDYAVEKFQKIEIFTNGTLITPDWVDYISENGIHLALSVYSYQPETHDRITGSKGSWAKTNKTISALRQRGIPYRVCNVLMKDAEIGQKSTELYELSASKDIVRMSGRANFSLLTDDLIRKQLITKKSFQSPIRKSFCGSLIAGHNCFRNRIYIAADLTVYPCVMERRLKHCTIGANGRITLSDSIRFFNKDKINECRCCEYRYVCFDCRPNSLSGNIEEKPWYCTYSPLLGEWSNEDEFIANLKSKWGKCSVL